MIRACLLLFGWVFSLSPSVQADEVFRLAFLSDVGHAATYDGVATAVSEAERPLRAAGMELDVKKLVLNKAGELDAAQRQEISQATAIILALPDKPALDVARSLAEQDTIVLNALATSQPLRAVCSSNLFHVAPSSRMVAAAAKGDAETEVSVWRNSWDRFAASQLKSRFSKRAGRAMTSEDWLVWFATDIVLEAATAERSCSPAALREYLVSPRARFHNYKGTPSSFGGSTRQLSQPLFIGDRVEPVGPDPRGPHQTDPAQCTTRGASP